MTTHLLEPDTVAKLDQHERQFRIPGPRDGMSLFLRYLPAAGDAGSTNRVVLYVHGGTFPSGLSIAHRFDGRSWRDALCATGFHVWGLDFPSADCPIPIPRCGGRPRTVRRSVAPRRRAVSSRQRFASSAAATPSTDSRSSPTPGERSCPAASPGAVRR